MNVWSESWAPEKGSGGTDEKRKEKMKTIWSVMMDGALRPRKREVRPKISVK